MEDAILDAKARLRVFVIFVTFFKKGNAKVAARLR